MQHLPHGGTNMALGLQAASALLQHSDVAKKIEEEGTNGCILTRIISYSDGHDQNAPAGIKLADRLKQQNLMLMTYGIASTPAAVDEVFLQRIAVTDEQGCRYRFLGDNPDVIYHTFDEVARGKLVF